MAAAVERLAEEPPGMVGDLPVVSMVDYRVGTETRPPWLGRQDLVELSLGEQGRILVRPSGTEPKLKIYVDLRETLRDEPETQRVALGDRATLLGRALESSLSF